MNHLDIRFLSNAHLPELRLLEIGGTPHFVERHDREKLLSRLHVQPDDNRFIPEPDTGAMILVYCRLSWACSSAARF